MGKITSLSFASYSLKHLGAILKFEFGGGECLWLGHWLSFFGWLPSRLHFFGRVPPQPRTQALSSTLLAGGKTLAGAGHVNTQILGGKLKSTEEGR